VTTVTADRREPTSPIWNDRRVAILLPIAFGLVAAVLLFYRLNSPALQDWDEAVYAQVSRQMADTGDWLTTRWADTLFFDKPPFVFWLEGTLFRIFGVTEFAARTPSALAGIGVVVLTFLVARRAYGTIAAIVAALLLVVSHGFLYYARYATLDTTLTFFSMLAVYGYARARAGRQTWWLLVGAALGFAIMTKSAAAWVPMLSIGLAFLLDREARRRFSVPAILGAAAAFLIVAAPWHLYMYAQYGEPFVRSYFGAIVLARAFGGHLENREDVFYYLSVLGSDFFPWIFVLPLGIAFGVADALRRASLSIVLVLITVFTVIVYSLVQVKLPWYMVIAYPPAAILIGGFVTNTLWPRRVTVALIGVAAFVAVILSSVAAGVDELVTSRVAYLLALLVVAIVVPVVWSLRRRDLLAVRLTAALVILLVLASANVSRPVLSLPSEPYTALAQQAAAPAGATGRGATVWTTEHYPTVVFYSGGRPVNTVSPLADFITALPKATAVDSILRTDQIAALGQCCDVTTLSQRDNYVYARITKR
jgi:4-amino-4-deoxy-L-arabinose transferase-like glycosyltransferase